ncbi:MAG: hypothetical protein WAT71_10220 [Ignavibacteria bacterium]
MLNSKVIDILKSFSDKEIKRFEEFLLSPFHTKNKKAALLFRLLSEYHPGYDNQSLTKENLFQKIFASEVKNYNDASIRNLLSDLMILAEKFLSYIAFEKDKFDVLEKGLRELSERRLSGVFDKKLNSTDELFNPKEFEGEIRFFNKHIIEELKSSSLQFKDNLKLYKDNSLIKSTDYLTYYYLIKIFKLLNFIEFQKQYSADSSSLLISKILTGINIEDVLKHAEQFSKEYYEILLVYYNMYKALAYPLNYDYYFEFKKSLLKYDEIFVPIEKYGLYVCLSNSCIQKIDNGDEKFFKECFSVYEIMFKKNVFDCYPGYLSMTTFTSVIITGLAACEHEKVEVYIKDNSDKLNPDHKSDAVNYAMSQLYFYKKEYEKALVSISKIDFEFSSFKYHLRITSLKIYFETGDYEMLYYTSDSFLHFINKNKMVGSLYNEEFRSFMKILDLLVKYKLNKDDDVSQKIKMLFDNKRTANKKWLVEKFYEMVSR